MPNRSSKKPKLPRDLNQRAKAIVDFLTRDRDAEPPPEPQVDETATSDAEPTDDAIRQATLLFGDLAVRSDDGGDLTQIGQQPRIVCGRTLKLGRHRAPPNEAANLAVDDEPVDPDMARPTPA